MTGKRLWQGLLVTLISAGVIFWAIGATANGDPWWFIRTFPANAQILVLHWDGNRYEFTPDDEGYQDIIDTAAKSIGEYAGYESSVVFSEINMERYRNEWRMLELRYAQPVQIHSRFDMPAARTFLIPLNYTHSNYRRVFAFPEHTTFCISAVNISEENMTALQNTINEAVLVAQSSEPHRSADTSSSEGSLAAQNPDTTIPASDSDTITVVGEDPAQIQTTTSPASLDINAQISALQGLDIDTFFSESWFILLKRDPEYITEAGLSAEFGFADDQLTDLSLDYTVQTQQFERKILDLLMTYDPEVLTDAQARSWRIYKTYLEDAVASHEFNEYNYPISQFIFSVHYTTESFFAGMHPLTSKQQAEAYILRLAQIQRKYTQVIDGIKRREENGIVLPRFLIQWALSDIRNIANQSAKSTVFYTTLRDKLPDIPGLSANEREDLLAQAEAIITESVQPAYKALETTMRAQLDIATDDAGVWKLPGGDRYYANRLRHYTTTDLTAGAIHAIGLRELERIHAEMRSNFDELGYPEGETIPQLYQRVAKDGGVIPGSSAKDTYETLIRDAGQAIVPFFDVLPRAEVIVIEDRFGGYYVPPAFDGNRPGAFYASTASTMPYYRMPSLAYHEAVPGHHLQIALAQELPNPPFQRGSLFTVHAEGWALYAEQLAWEVGLYADDPYGNLGRLQYEAHRAARLVIDTGIHAYQWDYDQAVKALVDATGMPEENAGYEVARYIVLPGQATAYKVGMLEILRLRELAQNELGESFSMADFHNAVLGSGSVPLSELAVIVDEYIASNR